MPVITVIKRDISGREIWRYSGEVLERGRTRLVLQAAFDREDMSLHGMPLRKGDRFVETYYTDRWYNIYAIHSRDDGRLRGWYCNVCRPARIEDQRLSYDDLALDLLVFPDGRQVVLDEGEFEALELDAETRRCARLALAELRDEFACPPTPAGA
ncbi:MAG: DUF402 domain-containing protein [Anaerolineales bacterium]|nr:DUF402 domain-containing protein [Anaerolineales bacterium]